jgi:hypothetical protein
VAKVSIQSKRGSMARNFGLTRQVDRQERAPVWPMWIVAFAVIGIINAATLLPHHR